MLTDEIIDDVLADAPRGTYEVQLEHLLTMQSLQNAALTAKRSSRRRA